MGHINISKYHHKLFLVLLAVLFIVMYFFIFQTKFSITTRIHSPKSEIMSNEYTSQFLKFKFLAPSGFIVNENGNTIVLSNGKNTISITRLFGYSSSVEEYLIDLAEKNNLNYIIENINQDNFYLINFILNSKSDRNDFSYFKNIDTDTFVSISTSSPELYDELDQIAASFEYLGDTKK